MPGGLSCRYVYVRARARGGAGWGAVSQAAFMWSFGMEDP